MKTTISLFLISILGFYAFDYQTNSFSVVTTESERRAKIKSNPIILDNALLLNAQNINSNLANNIKEDGRIAIVNFIYTRCADICISMGSEFQQLQQKIIDKDLSNKIRLISISFDERDNAKWLENYSQRMSLNSDIWRVYLAINQNERQHLLQQFGIVVIPAPLGQFEHNAAYHVVTPDAKLNNIIDIGQPDTALAWAMAYGRKLITYNEHNN